MIHLRKAVLVLIVGLVAFRSSAVTNIFYSVADTGLLEVNTNNNIGGVAGMFSGTTQNFTRTRALFRFDLASLPTNTFIQSASVELEVTKEPIDGIAFTPFGLYRMLRAWGEGNKNPPIQQGQGLPATDGEATWNHAFYPTNAWTTPGCAFGTDVSGIESSSQFIYNIALSPYRFDTTPETVADVMSWVRNPAANFGWMLFCDDENSNFTARRFGSREDVNHAPRLELRYLIPPQITDAQQAAGQFQFSFTGYAAQSYAVEFCTSLSSNNWQLFTNIGQVAITGTMDVFDTASAPQRFYRVNTW